jgi:hypothetical protein
MSNAEEIELNGRLYRRIGDAWVDENFISVPAAVERRLDSRRRASQVTPDTPAPAKTRRPRKRKRKKRRVSRYKETYPIIAGLIHTLYDASGDDSEWVTHDELSDALLDHPEGKEIVEDEAAAKDKEPERTASNMVATFSRLYTDGTLAHKDEFERERVQGRWAYRPVQE